MAENTPFGYKENEDLDNFVFEDLTDQYLDAEYPYIETIEEEIE
jgi:hypothetical protein